MEWFIDINLLTSRATYYDSTTKPSLLARCCGRHWGNSNYKQEACEEHLFYIKDKCNSDISIKYIWRTTRAVSWWSFRIFQLKADFWFRISTQSGFVRIASGNVATDCGPVSLVFILEMKLLFVVRFPSSKEQKWNRRNTRDGRLSYFIFVERI